MHRWARSTFLKKNFAIASPQLCKEMLLRNRNSAITQSQLENFTSAIFGIFLAVEQLEIIYIFFLPGVLCYRIGRFLKGQ
jgi:hypothetical protein